MWTAVEEEDGRENNCTDRCVEVMFEGWIVGNSCEAGMEIRGIGWWW